MGRRAYPNATTLHITADAGREQRLSVPRLETRAVEEYSTKPTEYCQQQERHDIMRYASHRPQCARGRCAAAMARLGCPAHEPIPPRTGTVGVRRVHGGGSNQGSNPSPVAHGGRVGGLPLRRLWAALRAAGAGAGARTRAGAAGGVHGEYRGRRSCTPRMVACVRRPSARRSRRHRGRLQLRHGGGGRQAPAGADGRSLGWGCHPARGPRRRAR